MNKAPNMHSSLNDERLFRLYIINKIEDQFTTEIKKRETMIKKIK